MRTSRLFDALPAYLGGKRRLVPLILADLAAELPRAEWPRASFCDPMCGGGAVALAAKAQGFEVYASDRARRGAIVAAALIANSSVRLREGDWLAALGADDLRGTGPRPCRCSPPRRRDGSTASSRPPRRVRRLRAPSWSCWRSSWSAASSRCRCPTPRTRRGPRELHRPEQAIVVGEGEGAVTLRNGRRDQLIEAGGAFEERVVGVQVQLHVRRVVEDRRGDGLGGVAGGTGAGRIGIHGALDGRAAGEELLAVGSWGPLARRWPLAAGLFYRRLPLNSER